MVMSKIIYNEDFISINGEIKETKTTDLVECDKQDFSSDIDLSQEIQKQLHLIFTIQVNGKLKNFEWFFILEENEIETGSTLKNWGEWYAILNLLTALGYKIGDYEMGKIGSGIIKQWIDELER